MRLVEVSHRPDSAARAPMIDFVEHQTVLAGSRPLSDHLWMDLRAGSDELLVARVGGVAQSTLALAQISATNESSTLEIVVDPHVEDRAAVTRDLAETIVDAYRNHLSPGRHDTLSWWLDEPDDETRQLAADLGLAPVRQLHEMRRTLPADRHATVVTRAFEPGTDDEGFLAVNNRAFADHGEQGGWTADTLALRFDESWFDPDGFRLHDIDGRIAAFCWTKVHRGHQPAMGEIYAIAVDPDFHGRGLGSQLTLAGLDWITDQGIALANLYVDGHNRAAVTTYERLGFHVHRTRWAFAGDQIGGDR